jgi:tRNA (mo5U34)-methyltransferase
MLYLDVNLDPDQIATMRRLPPEYWLAPVTFRNARSPEHPRPDIASLDARKADLLFGWIADAVPGRRVLDLFSANGAFSVRAALAGARVVTGIEASDGRVDCGRFLADAAGVADRVSFQVGDVDELLPKMEEPADVVFCLGALYHVADPARLLDLIRRVTARELILQTSHVLPWPGNWARFVVRSPDREDRALPSIMAGRGAWHCSRGCLRALLAHAGFEVIEERGPLRPARRRPHWYLARCRPMTGPR